jgi:hypothetical protein
LRPMSCEAAGHEPDSKADCRPSRCVCSAHQGGAEKVAAGHRSRDQAAPDEAQSDYYQHARAPTPTERANEQAREKKVRDHLKKRTPSTSTKIGALDEKRAVGSPDEVGARGGIDHARSSGVRGRQLAGCVCSGLQQRRDDCLPAICGPAPGMGVRNGVRGNSGHAGQDGLVRSVGSGQRWPRRRPVRFRGSS